jgi:hypothetical protein
VSAAARFGQGKGGIADVATILARAYLRLTEKRPNSEVFQHREPQKSLDVGRRESPHVGGEDPHGRPPWKRAS